MKSTPARLCLCMCTLLLGLESLSKVSAQTDPTVNCYALQNVKQYGKDCTTPCHCLNSQRCDRPTGRCPNDDCEPGYYGPSCQAENRVHGQTIAIRDANNNWSTTRVPLNGDKTTCEKGAGVQNLMEVELPNERLGRIAVHFWAKNVASDIRVYVAAQSEQVSPGNRVLCQPDGSIFHPSEWNCLSSFNTKYLLFERNGLIDMCEVKVFEMKHDKLSGPVRNLQRTASGSGQVKLTWDPPMWPNLQLSYYNITIFYYGPASCNNVTNPFQNTVPTNDTHYDYSLPANQQGPYYKYDFAVTAVTLEIEGGGVGESTYETVFTPSVAPTASPTNLVTWLRSETSLTMRWDPVPCDQLEGKFQHYKVVIAESSGGTVVKQTTAAGNTAELTGLQAITSYDVTVSLVTAEGEGPTITLRNQETRRLPPGEPGDLQVGSKTQTSVYLTWTVAAPNGPVNDVEYFLTCEGAGGKKHSKKTTGVAHNMTGLETASEYRCSLLARNGVGDSKPVNLTTYTRPKVPAAPVSVEVLAVTSTSATIRFFPSPDPAYSGAYLIIVQTINNQPGSVRRRRQSQVASTLENLIKQALGLANVTFVSSIPANLVPASGYEFTVGDGTTVGQFSNPPLVPGSVYTILVATANSYKGATSISAASLRHDFTASDTYTVPPTSPTPPTSATTIPDDDGGDTKGHKGGTKTAGIVGGVIGALVVIAIIIVIVIVVRKRKARNHEMRSSGPEGARLTSGDEGHVVFSRIPAQD